MYISEPVTDFNKHGIERKVSKRVVTHSAFKIENEQVADPFFSFIMANFMLNKEVVL